MAYMALVNSNIYIYIYIWHGQVNGAIDQYCCVCMEERPKTVIHKIYECASISQIWK